MKKRIGFLLVLIMALGIASLALAAVTTQGSGPAIGAHSPQHYRIDCATDTAINMTTGAELGNKGVNSLPYLYPGDTVQFWVTNGNMGYEFVNPTSVGDQAGDDGVIRVKVTEIRTFNIEDGAGNDAGTYNTIAAIEVVGKDLVVLGSGGGHTLFGAGHEYLWVSNLYFSYLPAWCQINTEMWYQYNQSHQMTAAETATAAEYSGEGSSTRAWSEDCFENWLHGADETRPVKLTVRRPYIEGMYFTGTELGSASGNNQISTLYTIPEVVQHGNFWEGWADNQIELYPQMPKKVANSDYGGIGSYSDELLVRYLYQIGRTLTLDACGGTIDGHATRIYEAEGRQFFNQELQEGQVDADFAAGRAYVPERRGYVFDGWYEDKAYSKPVTSFRETVNQHETGAQSANPVCRVYAKWLPIVKIRDCKVGKIAEQVYSGKKIKPEMKVTYEGAALTQGTDYTVKYQDNVNIGRATVTLTGKGRFTGTKTVHFNILPKAVKLSRLKAGVKQLTAVWKQGKNIDGYQIEYSLKKSFKDSKKITVNGADTTETVIRKLQPKKTYYVRIRTFKTVKGKKFYSAWSNVKSQKTK